MLNHLVVAGDVFDGVFLCCPFSHEMSWMRSGTELSPFFEGFLTCSYTTCYTHSEYNLCEKKLVESTRTVGD